MCLKTNLDNWFRKKIFYFCSFIHIYDMYKTDENLKKYQIANWFFKEVFS